MRIAVSFVSVLLFAGHCAGQIVWTQWVSAGSLSLSANAPIHTWIPAGGTDCLSKAVTIADFVSAYPTATGAWCVKFYADLAVLQNQGSPLWSCTTSGSLGNSAQALVEARIPVTDLNLPSGQRPSAIEVRFSHAPPPTGGTLNPNVSPILWKEIRLKEFSAGQPGLLLFEYRRCSTPTTTLPLGAWGLDGSNLACPPIMPPAGFNTFRFSGRPSLTQSTSGSGSGSAQTSSVGATLVSAPSGVATGDSVSVGLAGVPAGATAWLFVSSSLAASPASLSASGVVLSLFLSDYAIFVGPFVVSAAGTVATPAIDLPISFDAIPLSVQWLVDGTGVSQAWGASAALTLTVDWNC